jgi:hypothetical protein
MTVALHERAQFTSLAQALDPARVLVGMGRTPDGWQTRALRSRSKRRAILAARQVGKSEVMVAEALHVAAYRPGSVVGVVAPSLRQSAKLLRRVRRALSAVPGAEAKNAALTTLELANGSIVNAWPGSRPDLIRGDALDLLLIDESAFVHPDVFTVSLPMLAMSAGSLVMASTPGGPTGLMFDVMTAEDGSDIAEVWDRYLIRASDCPRFDPAELAAMRVTMGERAYAVEMECEWREDAAAVFTSDEIARMFGLEVVPDALPGEMPLPDEDWAADPWGSIVLSPI